MSKTGLYFGSFNPIHNGHLIIAQHMLNSGEFDRIRFVVSPQNPFKTEGELWDENLRFQLVEIATAGNAGFEVSDAEFHLPRPSYTIQTLNHFFSEEPGAHFSIILGSDNLPKLHEWKDIEAICKLCDFHVYRRRGTEQTVPTVEARFTFYDAPYLDISATYIREKLKQKQSVRYLVPEKVLAKMITL